LECLSLIATLRVEVNQIYSHHLVILTITAFVIITFIVTIQNVGSSDHPHHTGGSERRRLNGRLTESASPSPYTRRQDDMYQVCVRDCLSVECVTSVRACVRVRCVLCVHVSPCVHVHIHSRLLCPVPVILKLCDDSPIGFNNS